MTKKLTLVALVLVVACAVAVAKDPQTGAHGKPTMEAMKAEMMKCVVCKNIGMRMDEIGQMGMEAVKLNDGLIMSHWAVSDDPKKIAAFHAASDACSKAGEGCMTMTDEQAKAQLCDWCQSIRTAMKGGAHMSQGNTKKGCMIVMTATDPAVQAQLAALHTKCEMMTAMMEAPSGKMAADGK